MKTPRFPAVVLDLFGTLVFWRPEELPRHEFRGRELRTTLPLLFPLLEEAYGPAFDRDAWLDAYRGVIEEIQAERMAEGIEVTCEERFRRVLSRLPRDGSPPDLPERLTRRHMEAVRAVTRAPESHVEVVRLLSGRVRLGLLSNFDDAATGHELVADTGVADRFETVLISAEVGLRKPNPKIFAIVLDRLGVSPAEALFVGDTALEDVAGAQAVGMPVAWLARGKGPYPETLPPPDFTLDTLLDLPALLRIE